MSRAVDHRPFRDDDDPAVRRAGTAVVVLLHVAVFVALLQISAVRQTVEEAGAVFVNFIAPETPPVEVPPPPPTVTRKPPPTLISSKPVSSAPVEFVTPPAPPEPMSAIEVVQAPPAPPTPSAAPAPKLISAVEYIRRPVVEYPALSRRLSEQGRVVVRVLIDSQGNASRVELHEASRHARLNEAALKAAREALYKPHTENGVALSVWALVPIAFELQN